MRQSPGTPGTPYGRDDVRLPRVVAVVATIAMIALAVVPGAVSVMPSRDVPPAPSDFHPVSVGPSGPATVATVPAPASANASRGRLNGGDVLVEREAAHEVDAGIAGPLPWTLPAPELVVPAPSAIVAIRPAPTAAPATRVAPAGGATGGAWTRSQASFYGPGFYGHRMACSGILTESLRGVAHKTLPCGTLVTFRNPANGVVLTVPVVDRGPYVAGREWDLTGGACLVLDFCYTGAIDWHLGGP